MRLTLFCWRVFNNIFFSRSKTYNPVINQNRMFLAWSLSPSSTIRVIPVEAIYDDTAEMNILLIFLWIFYVTVNTKAKKNFTKPYPWDVLNSPLDENDTFPISKWYSFHPIINRSYMILKYINLKSTNFNSYICCGIWYRLSRFV